MYTNGVRRNYLIVPPLPEVVGFAGTTTEIIQSGVNDNSVGFSLCDLLRLDLKAEADKNETEADRVSTYLRS